MGVHHITIIGPPAVGKMTVGQAVASRLGYRFLHNHLTFDTALALHPYGSDAFFGLCDTLRLECLRSVLAEGTGGLVTTFCASGPGDIRFLHSTFRIVDEAGGRNECVALSAKTETLLKRVVAPERLNTNKVHDPAILRNTLASGDYSVVPTRVPVMQIPTDEMTECEVVQVILTKLNNRA